MPQIPRDVFFGEPAAVEAVAEQPVSAPPPVSEPVVPPATVEEDKVQVTVYLTPLIAKRLEALRFHLLNEHNVRVSKSAIAEYAIGNVDEDLVLLAQHFVMGER
jgi:hypothetical protein